MCTGPVIPVIVINEINDAVPLCQALVDGGLKVLEITLRSDCALEAISLVKEQVDGAIVGAGTVISVNNVMDCASVGAEFLVSPGTTTPLIDAVTEAKIPFLPGISSASEAMHLVDKGLHCMKLFPAEACGGASLLKSLYGPLPELLFCPTGGVHLGNAKSYLSLPNVPCIGGTWMLDPKIIAEKDWPKIEQQAKSATSLIN